MIEPTQAELDRALAVMLRAATWALDDAAHDIARGRLTAALCAELVESLEAVQIAVRVRAQRFDG